MLKFLIINCYVYIDTFVYIEKVVVEIFFHKFSLKSQFIGYINPILNN